MIISRLTLRNFKPFKKLSLDFPKFTLFLGPNSSGKSSAIAGILGVIQSPNLPEAFSSNGAYINLGDFDEIVNAHKHKSQFSIDVEFVEGGLKSFFESTWKVNSKTSLPRLISGKFRTSDSNLSIKAVGKGYNVIAEYDQAANKLTPEFMKNLDNFMEATVESASKNSNTTEKTSWKEISSKPFKTNFNVQDLSKVSSTLSSNLHYIAIGALVSNRNKLLKDFERSMRHVGAFRDAPVRTYYERTDYDLDVSRSPDSYIHQIAAWENAQHESFKRLTVAARNIGLFGDISIHRHHGGRFELRVRMQAANSSSSLIDTGFGVSQFLPVMVADLQLPSGGTLIVSQPEIHLHPSAQANFADYILEESNSRNKRYIIETHSEYLLNRFRLLVTQGKLSPDDIAVYYFTNAGISSKATSIKLQKDGRLKNAPDEFFITYAQDNIEIALTAIPA